MKEEEEQEDDWLRNLHIFMTTFGPMSPDILTTAHKLRHRNIVEGSLIQEAFCLESQPCQGHRGVLLQFDDGTSLKLQCDSINIGRYLYALLGDTSNHCAEYASNLFKNALTITLDRIAAIYWVANQQQWADLAEDLVPYIITAPSGGGGDERATKRIKH
jgi:hypothetical protein